MLGRGAKDKEHAMSQKFESAIAVIGIDIGKNSFHVVGHDERGAIVLRQKWSRGQIEVRFANMPGRHGSLRRRASSQPQTQ
jgi:transposase